MLLDGCSNAIEYELSRAKAKYDLTKPDGQVGYLKDAIEILSGRITPTERDVYAGRIAEETNVEKKAVLTQLDARVRARDRKARKEREQALLNEGVAAKIKVPYTPVSYTHLVGIHRRFDAAAFLCRPGGRKADGICTGYRCAECTGKQL